MKQTLNQQAPSLLSLILSEKQIAAEFLILVFLKSRISREISFSFAISRFHKYIIKTHQMLLLKESNTIVN